MSWHSLKYQKSVQIFGVAAKGDCGASDQRDGNQTPLLKLRKPFGRRAKTLATRANALGEAATPFLFIATTALDKAPALVASCGRPGSMCDHLEQSS